MSEREREPIRPLRPRVGAARRSGVLRRAAIERFGPHVARALQAGDAQLGTVERGRPRKLLLETLVLALPRRFDAVAAGDLDTIIALDVRDPDGGPADHHELVIRDGRCEVRRRGSGLPSATITIGAADLVRLIGGSVGWPALIGSGAIELAGDPFMALRVPTLLRLPVRAHNAS